MALDLNGTSDQVGMAIDALLRPALPVSVAAWVRPDTIGTGEGFYTSNKTDATHRGFWFQFTNSSGNLECAYGSNTSSTSTSRRSKVTSGGAALTTGSWQHVGCCIRGATDMDIYINGANAGGTYSGTGGTMAYSTITAGRIGNVGGALFDGRIGEVGVWTVSLTAAEMLALAKGVPPLKIRPDMLIQCIPLWTLSAIDLSSLRLDGVSVSGTVADHAPVGSPFPVAV